MSLVPRWKLTAHAGIVESRPDSGGPWVKYEDYAALEAKCERLERALDEIVLADWYGASAVAAAALEGREP